MIKFALVLVVALSGCSRQLYSVQFEYAQKTCENEGGVRNLEVILPYPNTYGVCASGRTFTISNNPYGSATKVATE